MEAEGRGGGQSVFVACAGCGATINRTLSFCPHCRTPLSGNEPGASVQAADPPMRGRVRTIPAAGDDRYGPADPAAPVVPATPSYALTDDAPVGRVRSIVGPTRLFRMLVFAWIGVVGIATAYEYATLQVVERLMADPLGVSGIELAQVFERIDLIERVQLFAGLAIVAATAAWLFRAYRNALALGARGRRFGPGWAIGGWFVPFLNFVRPKQVVDDTWRGSRPDGGPVTLGVGESVPVHLHLWWAAFLMGAGFDRIASVSIRSTASTADVEAAIQIVYVRDVALLAAAVLLERVAAGVGSRMAHRAAALGIEGDPAPSWALGLRSRPLAVRVRALGGFCLAVAAVVAGTWSFNASVERSVANPSGEEGILIIDLEVGDCFDIPADVYAVAVAVRECWEPHDFEVFAVVQHPGAGGTAFPGDDAVATEAFELCLDRFSAYVSSSYEESSLEIWYFYPTEDSWPLGDRETICLGGTIDGSQLEQTIRRSRL